LLQDREIIYIQLSDNITLREMQFILKNGEKSEFFKNKNIYM